MKMGIRGKMFSSILVSTLVMMAAIGGVLFVLMDELIVDQKLVGDMEMSYYMLDHQFQGDWAIEDGELTKGGKPITVLNGTLAGLANELNASLNIYMNDTIVVSSHGASLLDVKADPDVYNVVSKGDQYKGLLEENDVAKLGSYMPIKNKDGQVIGMYQVAMHRDVLQGITTGFLWSMFKWVAGSALVAFVTIFFLLTRIVKGLQRVIGTLDQVADGDLTQQVEIKGNDEVSQLGDAVNRTITKINGLITTAKASAQNVRENASTISGASDESAVAGADIAASMDEVTRAAEHSAHLAETGTEHMLQLTDSLERMRRRTNEINEISESVSDANQDGKEAVKELMDRSAENAMASAKVDDTIQVMNKQSHQIGMITETILGIADKTNLLALNASIESARAGEHGRGFAVVAGEIRELAEQSKKASVEIQTLVQDIQQYSNAAVEAMADASRILESHDESVEKTQESFDNVSNLIAKMGDAVSAIAKQTDNVEGVREGMTDMIEQISATTEETSAATEEVSASVEEQGASLEEMAAMVHNLEQLAESLQSEIHKFKV